MTPLKVASCANAREGSIARIPIRTSRPTLDLIHPPVVSVTGKQGSVGSGFRRTIQRARPKIRLNSLWPGKSDEAAGTLIPADPECQGDTGLATAIGLAR